MLAREIRDIKMLAFGKDSRVAAAVMPLHSGPPPERNHHTKRSSPASECCRP
jgi:hypothetical protein